MAAYISPQIEQLTFRDAAGDVIDYGNRWDQGPPEASYEVVEHPERFTPLHAVASALIDYLASNHEVTVEEGYHVTDGLTNKPTPADVKRAVRLTPLAGGCAPITFILTSFPRVRIHPGALFTAAYPSCGCNACDENWVGAADELEWQTLAIAGGGFTEEVSEPRRPKWSFDRNHGFTQGMGQTISYHLRALDGLVETSGKSHADNVPVAVIQQARSTLNEVAELSPEGNWLPWPLR